MKRSYQTRVHTVLEYIEIHLYDDLSVKQLSDIACLSQFHFHRIFTAIVGMSLSKYVQYLKLRRAAKQIVMNKDISILNAALDAGFDSHEAFSRAFKKHCGLTPNAFRKNPCWKAWQFELSISLFKRKEEMNITIETRKAIRVAAYRHHGDPATVSESAAKLINWAKCNNYPVLDGGGYCVAYDNPDNTSPEQFRADFCLDVGNNIIEGKDIQEQVIAGGRYAVYRLRGSQEQITDVVMSMFQEWLPKSGEELRELPIIFQYHNYEMNVVPADLITDICIPIQ
jgi:AraC family transcriptional regulator